MVNKSDEAVNVEGAQTKVFFKPDKISVTAEWNGVGMGQSKCRLWLYLMRENEKTGELDVVYEQDIFGAFD